MANSLRLGAPSLPHRFDSVSSARRRKVFQLTIRSSSPAPETTRRLVAEVKEKLEKEHGSLPVGKCGRDDEEMITWYLKDGKYSVRPTVSKLSKAIRWRKEFGVSDLTEESVKRRLETGKAYVHDYLDFQNRPVIIVDASKHFPGEPREDEKLCAFLIEKALSKLPAGQHEIIVIADLRGFKIQNTDLTFVKFVLDLFYCYYPRRLGQVLLVDPPFIFMPIWGIVKPMLKSYAYLVKFCTAKAVREEYFTAETAPACFKYS